VTEPDDKLNRLLQHFDDSLKKTMDLIKKTPHLQRDQDRVQKVSLEKNVPVRDPGDMGFTAEPRLVPGMKGYNRDLEQAREKDPIIKVAVEPELGKVNLSKDMQDPGPNASQNARQKFLEQEMRKQKLTRDPNSPALERDPLNPSNYDTPERRAAITAHLEKMGVDRNLQDIRALIEKSNAQPPHKAVEQPPRMTDRTRPRGPDPRGRDRGQERDR
jgi:hypothetical protein